MFKLSASGLVFRSVDFIRERIRKVIKYIYQMTVTFFLVYVFFQRSEVNQNMKLFYLHLPIHTQHDLFAILP